MNEKLEKLEKAMEGKTSYKEIIIENQCKEIKRLNNIIDEIEDYLSRFLYILNGITDRDIYEQCQLDDFTQVLDKLKELKGE